MSNTATTSSPAAPVRTIGAFCWHELHTRDTVRAADFYSKVVGWTTKACCGEGSNAYTEWQTSKGVTAGGMMPMSPGVPAQVPASWAVYVNVEDVDASLAKAIKLGGRKVSDPFDVPQVGRICAIADPTGAVLHLFKGVGQSGTHAPSSEPGRFCWTELLTTDTAVAEKFYTQLFGWTTDAMPMPGFTYTLFWLPGADKAAKTGGVGGMMGITPEMGDCPSNWLSYIAVEDVDAAAGRVTANGGKVCCPPCDIPNVGRFCVITDPTGATVALFKSL